jgi:hypothetical protein
MGVTMLKRYAPAKRHHTLQWGISRLFRNLDDEGWVFIFNPVKRTDFIGSMTLNLVHPTSFRSRITEIAGEPKISRERSKHNSLKGEGRNRNELPPLLPICDFSAHFKFPPVSIMFVAGAEAVCLRKRKQLFHETFWAARACSTTT